MSKIFIFGIGGTGSRVLRSLGMLLACGVKFGADEVVPIIIDPDKANADLTRSIDLLNKYNSIRSKLQFSSTKSSFFSTKINCELPNYTLHIRDTEDKSFKEFIEYDLMSKQNKAMISMLFSDKNLTSSMEVGFKGNPNIGSVVLNQISDSEGFIQFANSFSQDDRIFIISSIFGGTGASGFPLLLKTLREGKDFPNFDLINHATIGAITVLPYFKVQKDTASEIDSSTFISKTKSALAYYENNISANGAIDALYYLADDTANTYNNHEGGSSQRNDAHLIEFLAATAIVNFSNSQFENTAHLEFGIEEENPSELTFNSFDRRTQELLYFPMTQFAMMSNALTFKLATYKSETFAATKKYFKNFFSSAFFNDLYDFFQYYKEWLEEMKRNTRCLDLFNLSCGNAPFELVVGKKPKKILTKFSNYDLISARLNGAVGHCDSKETEDKFLEMFYIATKGLVKDKLS